MLLFLKQEVELIFTENTAFIISLIFKYYGIYYLCIYIIYLVLLLTCESIPTFRRTLEYVCGIIVHKNLNFYHIIINKIFDFIIEIIYTLRTC